MFKRPTADGLLEDKIEVFGPELLSPVWRDHLILLGLILERRFPELVRSLGIELLLGVVFEVGNDGMPQFFREVFGTIPVDDAEVRINVTALLDQPEHVLGPMFVGFGLIGTSFRPDVK